MKADMYTFSFICMDQWRNRFSFWSVVLVVESLCAFSSSVLLSSMMVKDVIPLYWFSTSSNIGDKEISSICFQQTESQTAKTLHNAFQRRTTVMDYRLSWKGGWRAVNQQRRSPIHDGQVQASFLSSFFLSFFPSHVSSSSLPFPPLLSCHLSSFLLSHLFLPLFNYFYFSFFPFPFFLPPFLPTLYPFLPYLS